MSEALIIIDVQKALFESTPRPFKADETIANINIAIDGARKSGIPVIFVHHEKPGVLDFGTDGWQLEPNLRRADSDICIRKTNSSAFTDTHLQKTLDELSVTKLVICGFATEYCVDSTVRAAASLGYQLKLVVDAHTTHDKSHAAAKDICEHHSNTLTSITSFKYPVKAVLASELWLE
ncbi:cysteine hydrolase family protein [Veronia pacifica]|uniref:Isochorismatase-like domain-containing protein n=1 Tax=Veronia pacifica TaxID=1080227 RepID=A0A1C3ESK7_9GAMM|nr:cysteine hydrolase family protein [Veronia pacifica]ODA36211.1 hypothetical protein A8L45_00995 [Veronia pacifica]